MSTTVLVARLRTSWEQADWGTFKENSCGFSTWPSLGKSRSKLLGPLGTQQTLAPKLFQLTDTECFATCWTCSWVVTGWENNNITEQPKPTGTNRPLKKFAMFHFPILLWPRTCSTTLWREWFNLFAWATSVWRKESCVQHATRLVSQQALSQPPVHEYDLCLYGKMFHGFDDSCRYDLVCCHVEDWARPWIYWMSQRFGPIVSAHTCCPPEKIQLPESVSQSW